MSIRFWSIDREKFEISLFRLIDNSSRCELVAALDNARSIDRAELEPAMRPNLDFAITEIEKALLGGAA